MSKDRRESQALLLLGYPVYMLFAGYVLFYAQALVGWWSRDGFTHYLLSAIAAVVLAGGVGVAGWLFARYARATLREAAGSRERLLILAGLVAVAGVLVIAGLLALKPAHLIQESDFPNYHLGVPKQNWLWGDWAAPSWSLFAFIGLTVQYGLSYLWVGLPLINRLPQYVFDIFLLLTLWRLPAALGARRPWLVGLLSVIFLLAFRGLVPQLGTAMLDLPALYFTVLVALLLGLFYRAPIEPESAGALSLVLGGALAGAFGYKSFSFVFVGALLAGIETGLRLSYRVSVRHALGKVRWSWAIVPLTLVWGLNLARSAMLTGDPFFPVLSPLTRELCAGGLLATDRCQLIERQLPAFTAVLSNYGYGHGPLAFLKAFALVPLAVDGPTRVNNAFDYPLGAFWYVAWGALALAALEGGAARRRAKLLGGAAALLFVAWFAGSQQSRWLYPVLVLLALQLGLWLESTRWRRMLPIVLVLALGAVGMNAARVVRAQRATLSCLGTACLDSYPRYAADYRRQCGDEPLELDERDSGERGYLNCRIRGRAH